MSLVTDSKAACVRRGIWGAFGATGWPACCPQPSRVAVKKALPPVSRPGRREPVWKRQHRL